MFNKYYQDELTYLRQLGQEFAAANPQVAHMLAETGTDPDVERLLEGFAFLTGRLRQRLDSELPELTHALVGLLWPHYLRPIPALSVVEFRPHASLQDVQTIPRNDARLNPGRRTVAASAPPDVGLPHHHRDARLETPRRYLRIG